MLLFVSANNSQGYNYKASRFSTHQLLWHYNSLRRPHNVFRMIRRTNTHYFSKQQKLYA